MTVDVTKANQETELNTDVAEGAAAILVQSDSLHDWFVEQAKNDNLA